MKLKKIAIVLNGNLLNKKQLYNDLKNFQYIACADGGCKFLINSPFKDKILFVAGDFDSFSNPEKYFPDSKIYRFNKEKDFTDAFGTYEIAKKRFKFNEFHFFVCSGNREDHFLSLIYSFVNVKEKIYFYNDFEIFEILHPGEHNFFKYKHNFSIFPLKKVTNLIMEGVKYTFNETVIDLTGQGVSNIFVKEVSKIKFEKGIILLSIIRKHI